MPPGAGGASAPVRPAWAPGEGAARLSPECGRRPPMQSGSCAAQPRSIVVAKRAKLACDEIPPRDRRLPLPIELRSLAGLAQEDRGGLAEDAAPSGGLLGLLLGRPLNHAAHPPLGDLEPVPLGDLLVAVVVLGQRRGDRFEAM